MPNKETATEAIVPAIAPEEDKASVPQDDAQARYEQLEAEKENYRKAYLKEAEKNKRSRDEEEPAPDEDERIERIARKALADSRLAEIAREQNVIIQKTLKENRELKLAQLNKNSPPAAMGTHSESVPVRDSLIAPEQMKYFKETLKWSDKEIERYKKNLGKRV